MRVLSLTSSYPRFAGDATAPFIESITTHIAALGHEIDVVLPEHREWRRPPVEDGVRFYTYRYSPWRGWTPWGYSQSLEAGVRLQRSLFVLAPVVYGSAVRVCTSLAKRSAYDVIHAHWLVPNGLIGATASKRLRKPLVVSLHGSDISVAERSRWLGSLVRRAFAQAAAVTAPSEDLLERARGLGATGRLELIPYGADEHGLQANGDAARALRTQLALSHDDVMVLALGRFVHWKGFGYLIDAVAEIDDGAPLVRLVFAGDGDLRPDLVERARRLGLGDRVQFAGMVARNDLPAYLAAADIVAVPSVHHQGFVDGLPNVALEAMAAGKPLVATRVGGLPEVVRDGENGLLVDERDAHALASAIRALAGDPDVRRRMGEAGRKLVRESLNWSAVGARYASVLEETAASR
jgi:glycosyltransferase involved in cell wall biosynthesis